jgi:hypothetical protein
MDDKIAKLEHMKTQIENLDKTNQLDILKLLKKNTSIVLNENKSGIYINLTYLSDEILEELEQHMKYINDQEVTINEVEDQKTDVKNEYFNALT